MYFVYDAVNNKTSKKSKPLFTDDFIDSTAYTFVMNESFIAMSTFLDALDNTDANVPIHLLEPLLVIAKYSIDFNSETTEDQFDALCDRLLTNAKTDS